MTSAKQRLALFYRQPPPPPP